MASPRLHWFTIKRIDYASFHQKLEIFQYNVALTITGFIMGTPREKLYEGLGLESLQLKHW